MLSEVIYSKYYILLFIIFFINMGVQVLKLTIM